MTREEAKEFFNKEVSYWNFNHKLRANNSIEEIFDAHEAELNELKAIIKRKDEELACLEWVAEVGKYAK